MAITLPYGADEREELVDATQAHIRWGLSRAADSGDIDGISQGSIHELSLMTCPAGSEVPLIPEERLRRRLLPGPQQMHPFEAWEYLMLCFDLGISTNPFVEQDRPFLQ